jgi:hypothetical protein
MFLLIVDLVKKKPKKKPSMGPWLSATLTIIMLEYYKKAGLFTAVEAEVGHELELAGLVARAKCARGVARISCDDSQQPGLLF